RGLTVSAVLASCRQVDPGVLAGGARRETGGRGMGRRGVRVATGGAGAADKLDGGREGYIRDGPGGGRGGLGVWGAHATAGLAIIESGAGSDIDLLAALRDLLPPDDRWRHRHGSVGHGRDHVLPAFLPPFAMIPVIGGRMALGTWQSVVLVDTNTDNQDRQIRLSFLAG